MPVLPARRRPWPSGVAVALVALALPLLAGTGHALARVPLPHLLAPPVPPDGPWTWPLPPPHVIVQGFDPPAEPWLPGQRGVVLQGHRGEPVLAAGDGSVGFAGPVARVGVVSLLHGPLRTTYEPVTPAVHRGQAVHEGQLIGHLGGPGSECAPRACLHWGLLRGGDYLDPMSLLGREVISLLPLRGRGG